MPDDVERIASFFTRSAARLPRRGAGSRSLTGGAGIAGRGRAQFVEIALAHLRIARFKTLLVGDRLLLDELDRYGAPLQVVQVEQPFGRAIADNADELIGEVHCVLNAAV